MKSKKVGLSLVVLIITILLMIILASALIASLVSNKPVLRANETKVKSDLTSLRDEWNDYYSNSLFRDVADSKSFNSGKLNVDKNGNIVYKGKLTDEGDKLSFAEAMPSLEGSDFEGRIFVVDDEIYLDNRDGYLSEDQQKWAKEVGINVLNEGVVLTLSSEDITLAISQKAKIQATVMPDVNKKVNFTMDINRYVRLLSDTSNVAEVQGTDIGSAILKASVTTDDGVTVEKNVVISVETGEYVKVAKIVIDPTDVEIQIGEEKQLNATVYPHNALVNTLEWQVQSENPRNTVKISQSGVVKGINAGNAQVVAIGEDGSITSNICNVKVIDGTIITLDKTKLTRRKGEKEKLTATVLNNPTGNEVVWKSDNPGIADVDNDGNVSFNEVGTTTITATCNSKSVICEVEVLEPIELKARTLEAKGTEAKLEINANTTFDEIEKIEVRHKERGTENWVKDETITVNDVEYTTQDYVISDLIVEKTFDIEITAYLTDGTSKNILIDATPKKIPVTAVKVTPTSKKILIGETIELSVTVEPENATNKAVSFSTSSDTIATVSSSGVITGNGLGLAKVTVTSQDNPEAKAECQVNVIDYIPNEPELFKGMTPIVFEDDGTPVDTTYDNPNWYSYLTQGAYKIDKKEAKWANARTEDGSQWVWIPRFAYKINYQNPNNKSQVSEISIIFMKGKSYNEYVDTDGQLYTELPEGYRVHPVFTDESNNGYANGGWDEELSGIWIAKYEASKSDIKNSNNVQFPKFIHVEPNESSYNYINVSTANLISETYTEDNNPYGLSSFDADVHLTKNSEWGAVAYLAQSRYGRNGIEVTKNEAGRVTEEVFKPRAGYGLTIEDTFNTENGKLASTTGNLYGVYDMSAGAYEYTSAYLNNGNVALTSEGKSLLDATPDGKSTKYISVYNMGETDNVFLNYAEEGNAARVGEAIWETSNLVTGGSTYASWNNDSMSFPNNTLPFFSRGGGFDDGGNGPGIFAVTGQKGVGGLYWSFRAVVCEATSIANAPDLLEGMTPIKFNEEDGSVEETTIDDPEWYDYKSQGDYLTDGKTSKWANAETEDGSQWVWIPRYAYKINYEDPNDKSKASEIDVKFMKDTSYDICFDDNGREIPLPEGYIVHPAFTDESTTNIAYKNGGWDAELTGIWIAKYEAGYAGRGEVKIPAKPITSISNQNYPVFVPNANIVNNISISNAFSICKALNEDGNPYGFNKAISDTHQIKNSEWGAVAYLTQSKYGRNGNEVTINSKNNGAGVTGYGNTVDGKFNTENGKLASSTGNMYGVYDLRGGHWEYAAGYQKGIGKTDKNKSLLEEAKDCSTKYVTVYDGAYDSKTNKERVGEAIWETSSSGNYLSKSSWFKDFSSFSSTGEPYIVRSGGYCDHTDSGIFYYFALGDSNLFMGYGGYRPVVCRATPPEIVANKPELLDGMTPITFDNDGNTIEIDENDKSWYNYRSQGEYKTDGKKSKWANVVTEDGSQWVWIPRYAYKINYENESNKSIASEIDVIFLNGTSDTEYIDTNGEVHNLPEGYIVHPAFKDESENGFANGGWDEELTGIWVAKYKAGFAGIGEVEKTTTKKDSSVKYTSSKSNVYGSVSKDTTNVSYPVFMPNAYSYNDININDIFDVCKALNENGNPYNFIPSTADTHLIKNSEWGAVVYLTQSKYGRNGNEVTRNSKLSNGNTITGYGNTEDGKFNTENGQLASSTGNLFGIYDLNGGLYDFTSGFIKGYRSDNCKSLMYETNNSSMSTKYVSLYNEDYNNSDNVKRVGEAIWETASWFGDISLFPNLGYPFTKRGACYRHDDREAGIFGFDRYNDLALELHGFRPVVVKNEVKESDAVAKIVKGDKTVYYKTLQDAFNASSKNENSPSDIYLLKNITNEDSILSNGHYAKLHLQEHTLSSTLFDTDLITNNGNLEIVDSGNISSTYSPAINNVGNIKLSNSNITSTVSTPTITNTGIIEVAGATISGGAIGIYNSSTSANVKLSSGTISGNTGIRAYGLVEIVDGEVNGTNAIDFASGKINITGGTLNGGISNSNEGTQTDKELTIGVDDGEEPSTTVPAIITGSSVIDNGNEKFIANFYDGYVKGSSQFADVDSVNVPVGYEVVLNPDEDGIIIATLGEKQIESVPNKPELQEGMTAITFNTDGTVKDTDVEDPDWYSYESQGSYKKDNKTSRWANVKTKDGSQWVWIPRFAYKIVSQPSNSNNEGGEIDIIFLKETSYDTFIDKEGVEHPLPEGYIVHPAFIDESENGFANGGWDAELTGIWVSKYEAGYAGVGEVQNSTTKNESSITYSKTDSNAYGKVVVNETKIPYPVFVPNAYSYSHITINDIYNLNRYLNEKGNPYGLNSYKTDSHLIKNSEWGAVAYLTQSRYGRNGTEVSRNAREAGSRTINSTKYGVTGHGDANTDEDKFNTEGGMLASSTGNLYGVYDLRGGHYEQNSGYINNGNENLSLYGSSLLSETEDGLSTKYISVYNSAGYNDETNKKRVGEALWETAGWFGDYKSFASPFFKYGGTAYLDKESGIFSFSGGAGGINYDVGFRTVLCKATPIESVANKPEILDGMTPITFEDNGTPSETNSDDENWYNYESQGEYMTDGKTSKWANVKTEDGSQWVWIPRYAYKIISQPEDYKTSGGEIDIIFLKGTTDNTYIDKKGIEHRGLPPGYIVHPAFKDESEEGYKNGGWDAELTGIWVAKYEAGKAGVGEVDIPAKPTTKVTDKNYPVFVPNANLYNSTTISDMYTISKNLNEKDNPYGFISKNVDTHMLKNSEWGAVAYLTQSKYGRNGIEIEINSNSEKKSGYGNGKTEDYKFNTENGQLASTTGNIYGVYDLSGGLYEYTSGYLNNGTEGLTKYGKSLLDEANGISTKYVAVYNVGSSDTVFRNYDEENNKSRVGEAIWETSNFDGSSNAMSWFHDFSYFPNSGRTFLDLGGCFSLSKAASGLFSFQCDYGTSYFDNGFRPVVCKATVVTEDEAVAKIIEGETTTYYKKLQDAFDDSSRDESSPSDIYLLKGIDNKVATLENGYYANLHLQGFNLSSTSVSDNVIVNKGNLEIIGTGTLFANNNTAINNLGNLKLTNCTVQTDTGAPSITNTGTIELNGATVGNGYIGIYNNSTLSTIKVTDGTISGSTGIKTYGKVEILDGEINGTIESAIDFASGEVNITGGVINGGISNSIDNTQAGKELTIGVNDEEEPSITEPVINTGSGVIDNGENKFIANFYDGCIKGEQNFADKEAVIVPDGYEIVENQDEDGMLMATLVEKRTESVPNKPELYTGMTPIKFDENGNVIQTENTDLEWYSYESQGNYKTDGKTSRWANAETEDGSQWVWIPRYAYKIVSEPNDKETEGGEIDVIFLKETSDDIYIDKEGKEHKLPSGYIVHPAFKDESEEGYKNGGWDAELTGIWVAKYEAGYGGIGEIESTTNKIDTPLKYTVLSTHIGNPYGSMEEGVTKITYPVFVPNAYSYNIIAPSDIYELNQYLNQEGNPYGLESYKTDSHLMKNSEWGAVAYLTQSKYGRNGEEVSRNARELNPIGKSSIYGSTGHGDANTDDDKFNTEGGMLASTTGNLYGVYDLRGGHYEYVAGYVNNGSTDLNKFGESLVNDTTINGEKTSTKYISVFENGYDNETNKKRVGEVLWETAGWFGDYKEFGNPFFKYGGTAPLDKESGIFSFINGIGYSVYDIGFRTVLCKATPIESVANKPELLTGMTPITFGDDGTPNDTEADNPEWYDYVNQGEYKTDNKTSKWANARTEDGSQWVWIPRYAYKIVSQPKDYATEGGEIDIIFLKGTSDDTYIDKRGIEHKGLPEGYIVHPTFKDESEEGYKNGGWDEELSGFWVAKYEAGFAQQGQIEKTTTMKESSLMYSSSTTSNRTENIYGDINEGQTKISYPVFMPNAYSYNNIGVGDIFSLSKILNEKDNPYGFTESSADTHLIKNSEWGAVAYLTQSRYGRNGIEVSQNNEKVNNINSTLYSITGYGDKFKGSGGFNTENGKLTSTTGNLYGIYDMGGGNYEYSATYLKGGKEDILNKYGSSLLKDSNDKLSTKYVSVYEGASSDGNENYNNEINKLRKGEAIWETSTTGTNSTSWYGNISSFLTSGSPFLMHGGNEKTSDGGLFFFGLYQGYGNNSNGFRPVVCKATVVTEDEAVAKIVNGDNTVYYKTLQDAINNATSGTSTSIELIKDIKNESVTYDNNSGAIVLSLNGNKINSDTGIAITNKGNLTILGSGIISSSADSAISNMNILSISSSSTNISTSVAKPAIINTGTLIASNANISSTGGYGGYGISSTSTSAIVNLENTTVTGYDGIRQNGTLTMGDGAVVTSTDDDAIDFASGTINLGMGSKVSGDYGVYNYSSSAAASSKTLNIGLNDNNVDTSSPVIEATYTAVYNGPTKFVCNFYDGYVLGSPRPFDSQEDVVIPDGYEIVVDSLKATLQKKIEPYGTNGNKTSGVTSVNKPELLDGMTPITFNTSTGASQNTVASDSNWYAYIDQGDYKSDKRTSKWANAKTEDGSQWVWIPRFAYKILSKPTTSSEVYKSGGDIDVIFLEGTSKTNYTDSNGQKHTSLPEGYIVHPAFTDESNTSPKFKNGGWDEELTGIWVAKYEAGYTGIGDVQSTTTKNESNLTYTSATTNVYGEVTTSTKITYPAFIPNAYSYDYISINDIYRICKELTGTKNPYGFNSNTTDTHLTKNSEWGAIVYLTHSDYGRNGVELTRNTRDLLNTPAKIRAVTGYGSQNSESNKFNTSNAQLCSSTGNLYGVYDLYGGTEEAIAGYLNNNNQYLQTNGKTLVDEANGTSTKYISVYNIGTSDYDLNNYDEPVNSARVGEAIWETSLKWSTTSVSGWFSDYTHLPSTSNPFISRDVFISNISDLPGIFAISPIRGNAITDIGFRPICVAK